MSRENARTLHPEYTVDTVVIGAGVVGLAIARRLAQQSDEVYVFEQEQQIGQHTSGRNSEVIHGGMYYPPGSLKAELCVVGRRMLYPYCEEKGIEHERLGKLIVATSEREEGKLHTIYERAQTNGVNDLAWMDQQKIKAEEPMVRATKGLYSPSTGIIDSHGLMKSLQRDAKEDNATVIFSSPMIAGEVHDDGIVLSFGGADPVVLKAQTVINSAGLWAADVARNINGMPKDLIPKSYYTKGQYFSLSGQSPFSHLVYPIPEEGGLGIHVTLDLGRRVRFGPNVSPVDGVDYRFDATEEPFYEAIRKYYPDLPDGALQPDYTGIRPKLRVPRGQEQDFVIQGRAVHGIPGLVHLFGIESPGLTASLAIADYVAKLLKR